MSLKAKIYVSMLVSALLLGGLFLVLRPKEEQPVATVTAEPAAETVLTVWYSDAALTDYINTQAVRILNEREIHVRAVLKSGLSYLDEIEAASLAGEDYPDLCIMGTESLEKAALLGIAMPVADTAGILNTSVFPENAISAVSYKGQAVAYPFYYELPFLLYNKDYMRVMAEAALYAEELQRVIDADLANEDGSEAVTLPEEGKIPDGYTEESWQEAIDTRAEEMVPVTVEDIKKLATGYSAPEGMENFFVWDVADVFYDYFFAGAYMSPGGAEGDDPYSMDICNDDTVSCMEAFQTLHSFFSLETSESSYESILQDFLDGKTLLIIASADALQYMGDFSYAYGIAPLPGVDDKHISRALALTECVTINSYSEHTEEAEIFASYLVNTGADQLFERMGVLPCAVGKSGELEEFWKENYARSASLPKLWELNDFWIRLELAYTKVWNGDDPREVLEELEKYYQ